MHCSEAFCEAEPSLLNILQMRYLRQRKKNSVTKWLHGKVVDYIFLIKALITKHSLNTTKRNPTSLCKKVLKYIKFKRFKTIFQNRKILFVTLIIHFLPIETFSLRRNILLYIWDMGHAILSILHIPNVKKTKMSTKLSELVIQGYNPATLCYELAPLTW